MATYPPVLACRLSTTDIHVSAAQARERGKKTNKRKERRGWDRRRQPMIGEGGVANDCEVVTVCTFLSPPISPSPTNQLSWAACLRVCVYLPLGGSDRPGRRVATRVRLQTARPFVVCALWCLPRGLSLTSPVGTSLDVVIILPGS